MGVGWEGSLPKCHPASGRECHCTHLSWAKTGVWVFGVSRLKDTRSW